jgi:hypothetical protein
MMYREKLMLGGLRERFGAKGVRRISYAEIVRRGRRELVDLRARMPEEHGEGSQQPEVSV